MKSEVLIAITQLSAEKNLPREVVFDAVEAALTSAYRKDQDGAENVYARVNPDTGEVRTFFERTVVDKVEDPVIEIALPEARKFRPAIRLGETVEIDFVPTPHAGRIAAQTAKQVVLQRLREAEREVVYEEYSGKEADIVSGTVQRVEPRQAIIDLGKTEAVLPAPEQVRNEHYRAGQRLKVYVLEVFKASKGPQVLVSRRHKNLIKRLFELEVPEIHRGVVEIKAIAREPGYRSKVAVWSRQEGIDAVGACVGLRGIRIQNVVNELGGERIDVIQWDPDPARFVANALAPATVINVVVSEEDKKASVVVPDKQLSLAIGKEGQNARLAAKLTGWRIDIMNQSTAEATGIAGAPETATFEPYAPGEEPEPEPEPVIREPLEPAAVVAAPQADTPEVAEPVVAQPEPEPVLAGRVEPPPPGGLRFGEDLLPGRAAPAGPAGGPDRKKKKKGGRDDDDERAAARRPKRGPRVAFEEEDELDEFDYSGTIR
jgi:N utilization substance protein A